jgi:tetratricopeptide (TPR) repeat protein
MHLTIPEQFTGDKSDTILAGVGGWVSTTESRPPIPTVNLERIGDITEEYSTWYDACLMLGSGPIPVELIVHGFHIERAVVDVWLKALEFKEAILIKDEGHDIFEIPSNLLHSRRSILAEDRQKGEQCAQLACNAIVIYLKYLNNLIRSNQPSAKESGEKAKESGEKAILEHVDACVKICFEYISINCEWDILANLCESYGFYTQARIFYAAVDGQTFGNGTTDVHSSQAEESDPSESVLVDAWRRTDDPSRRSTLAIGADSPDPLSSVDTNNSRTLRNKVALIRMQMSAGNFEDLGTQLKPSVGNERGTKNQDRSSGPKLLNPIEECTGILKEVEHRNEYRYVSLKAEALQLMALISARRGDWQAAVQWSRDRIDTLEKLHGPNAEETVEAICELADIFMDRVDYGRATPLLESVLLTYEQEFGGSDDKSIAVAERLGEAYYKQGEMKKARDFYRRVAEAKSNGLGEHHIETAKAQERLAEVYFSIFNMIDDQETAKKDEAKKDAIKWYANALETARNYGPTTADYEKMSARIPIPFAFLREKWDTDD